MDSNNSSLTLPFFNNNSDNELDHNQSVSVQSSFLLNSNTTLENHTTTNYINSTTNAHDYAQDDIAYILTPVIVIMAIAFFSGMALLCIQRQKKERYRHRFIPIYKFTPENDETEWSVLIDNETIKSTNPTRTPST